MRSSSFTTSRGRLVICSHCGYEWLYRGKAEYATCPKCGLKTPVYVVSHKTVNKIFERLAKYASTEERAFFELIRVIILNYSREGVLKPSLLRELQEELSIILRRYTNTIQRGRRGPPVD